MAGYKTLRRGGTGEYIQKKSRFLSEARPVRSMEEVQAFINSQRKKYYDARHHCSACILGLDSETMHSSDDGEPQGTAGRPMLDLLKGENLTNTAIVVTRYFGGTLLGAGNLVRAYQQAARAALEASEIIENIFGVELALTVDYAASGKLKYLLEKEKRPMLDTSYTDQVTFRLVVPEEEVSSFRQMIREQTGGQGRIREIKRTAYAVLDGKIRFD